MVAQGPEGDHQPMAAGAEEGGGLAGAGLSLLVTQYHNSCYHYTPDALILQILLVGCALHHVLKMYCLVCCCCPLHVSLHITT